ncbi:MAG TPA: cytochrome c peroxidase [Pirellulales bacterium]|jgi:cytochrome c peroxidase|nr:cytochrome c peroxidase [Pirellulales bacterium]
MGTRCRHFAASRLKLIAAGLIALSAWALPEISLADDTTDAALAQEARKNFEPLLKDAPRGEHPATREQVSLGRMLFFDPRISDDGTGSCVRCHQPALYGADGLPKSLGLHDKRLARNAPTVLNMALQFKVHWDGLFETVEAQASKALLGPGFGNPDHPAAVAKLNAIPGYAELFRKAFPDDADPVTAENWGRAVGAYERTLLTPSRFDEFLSGKSDALTTTEQNGLRTFMDRGCIQCHDGVGVGGDAFEKFGVVEDYWKQTHSQEIDKGRFNVTKDDDDLYVFKVPSLRNVAMTPPYFHDGSVKTLAETVAIMGKVQLGTDLSQQETDGIVAFLGSLTGQLPDDFANAPLLPTAGFEPAPTRAAGDRR